MNVKEKQLHKAAVARLSAACRSAATPAEIMSAAQMLDDIIFRSGNLQRISSLLEAIIRPSLTVPRTEPLLLFHAYGWQYGGAERVIAQVANWFAAKRYRIVLTVFEPIRNTSYPLDPAIVLMPVCEEPQRIRRLLILLDLLRPDIFFGHNSSIPELARLYPLLRQRGIRTVAYTLEHFFFPHHHPGLAHTADARSELLAQANAACFLTRFSANVYGLAHPNAAVMPIVGPYRTKPLTDRRPPGKTVLAVGRFDDPIKRLDRVLTAFSHLLTRHPDARLIVVGPYRPEAHIPPEAPESIAERIERLGLPAAQLSFVGEQPLTEPYYEEADLFILTSNSEGLPLVLLEAGAAGLPSVIVDIPGLEDVISDGVNGFIVPQDDMRQMADKLATLLDDAELRERMSRAAREQMARFSAEQLSLRWEQLIELLLSNASQEQINRILAERFMRQADDPAKFAQQMAQQYEQAARIRASRNNAGLRSVVKLAAYWRSHGGRQIIGLIKTKLHGLARRSYTLWTKKWNGRS